MRNWVLLRCKIYAITFLGVKLIMMAHTVLLGVFKAAHSILS
jgi:hypothetical protein